MKQGDDATFGMLKRPHAKMLPVLTEPVYCNEAFCKVPSAIRLNIFLQLCGKIFPSVLELLGEHHDSAKTLSITFPEGGKVFFLHC